MALNPSNSSNLEQLALKWLMLDYVRVINFRIIIVIIIIMHGSSQMHFSRFLANTLIDDNTAAMLYTAVE